MSKFKVGDIVDQVIDLVEPNLMVSGDPDLFTELTVVDVQEGAGTAIVANLPGDCVVCEDSYGSRLEFHENELAPSNPVTAQELDTTL